MEYVNLIFLNFFSAALVITVLISYGRLAPKVNSETTLDLVIYFYLCLSVLGILILDAIFWLGAGYPKSISRNLYIIVNVLYFSLHLVPSSLYLLYADYHLAQDKNHFKKLLSVLGPLNIIVAALSISSPWTGFLFTISPENVYIRGKGMYFFILAIALITLFGLLVVIKGREKLIKKTILTLILFPILTITGGIFQAAFFGLSTTWPTIVIFIVAAALNIQKIEIRTDYLTGLMNRRSLEHELKLLLRNNSIHSLGGIALDLNNFKLINDTWGHQMGDCALEDAARVLVSAARQEDTVARIGGDEFILLIPGSTQDHLEKVAKLIRDMLALQQVDDRHPYALSFSMGIGMYDSSKDIDTVSFLKRLDSLMYEDKVRSKLRK